MTEAQGAAAVVADDRLEALALTLGSCAVYLRAEKGWRLERDGTYVTDGSAALEIPYGKGAVIPFQATLIRVRTQPLRIMPRLKALPIPGVGFLKGAKLPIKVNTKSVESEVRFGVATGAVLKARDSRLPLKDERSYLYATVRNEFEIQLPRMKQPFVVSAGQGNTAWFVLDPCDPLVLLSAKQLPPGFYLESGTVAMSLKGELDYVAQQPVWDGAGVLQSQFTAHLYFEGAVGLTKIAGLGIGINGRLMANVGTQPASDILQRLLPGNDLVMLPTPVKFGVEGAGQLVLPLPYRSKRIPRGSAFTLSLAGATLLIEGGEQGRALFTGNVAKILEGTPFAQVFKLEGDTAQVQGYYNARDDWGMRLRTTVVVAGKKLTDAALVFRVSKDGVRVGFGVPDGEPQYTIIHWTAADVAQVTEFLRRVGYDVNSAAVALRAAIAAPAEEAMRALARVYRLEAEQAGVVLKRAGYPAVEVVAALRGVYQVSADGAARVLKLAGYGADQALGAVRRGFGNAGEVVAALRKGGYSAREVQAAVAAQDDSGNDTTSV